MCGHTYNTPEQAFVHMLKLLNLAWRAESSELPSMVPSAELPRFTVIAIAHHMAPIFAYFPGVVSGELGITAASGILCS